VAQAANPRRIFAVVATVSFCALVVHSVRFGVSGHQRMVRVVQRPNAVNAFEFAVLAGLRAGQLARGCTPRVTCAAKVTVTAQLEVAEGKVVRQINGEPYELFRSTF